WPRLIQEHGVTIFAAVPGVFRQILKYGGGAVKPMRSLRHCLSAGERLPQRVSDEWGARTGTKIYQALGQSELSTFTSSSPAVTTKPGTVGKPQAGRRVVILDEGSGEAAILEAGKAGLIAVHRSDPGLMLGLWGRKAEEAQMFRGEWFIGGD